MAVLGGVLTSRLTTELVRELSDAGRGVDPNALFNGTARIAPELAAGAERALASSLHTVFVLMVPLAVVAMACAFALQERTLARTHEERG